MLPTIKKGGFKKENVMNMFMNKEMEEMKCGFKYVPTLADLFCPHIIEGVYVYIRYIYIYSFIYLDDKVNYFIFFYY